MKEFNDTGWDWKKGSRLFVLTGAGISAESGIATFRDSGGLWEGHSIEEVATPEGFIANPALVIDFYNQRRKQLKEVTANSAHFALAKLQMVLKDRCYIVTQNVDNLHEAGGAKQVLHMHGELNKLRCLQNEHILPFTGEQDIDMKCQICDSKMRPHIVWFGEIPFNMNTVMRKIDRCTHFIAIGTSGQVYPAAGFLQSIGEQAKSLCLNLKINMIDNFDFYIEGKATKTVQEISETIIHKELNL